MTKMNSLKLAVDSQDFYHKICLKMEKQIDSDIRYIADTDFEEWRKDRIEQTLNTCQNLMLTSAKFVDESEKILNQLITLTREEYESDVKLIAEIALTTRATMSKQKEIYQKLIELQGILIEIIERF